MDLVEKYIGEGAFKKTDWEDFYNMAKDKSGKTLKAFEKKYGGLLDYPHVKDALDKAKNFKAFKRMIDKF